LKAPNVLNNNFDISIVVINHILIYTTKARIFD
jgi:hypothetical protein